VIVALTLEIHAPPKKHHMAMQMYVAATLPCPPVPLLLAGSVSNSSTTLCLGSDCYVYNVIRSVQSAAQSKCISDGGTLWLPRDSKEALAVESWFGLLNNRHTLWIGLNRTSSGASWTPLDGSTLSYTHWCVTKAK
jgi:hypothetical protein